jgi:hypothetical protein
MQDVWSLEDIIVSRLIISLVDVYETVMLLRSFSIFHKVKINLEVYTSRASCGI